WLNKIGIEGLLKLCSRYTVARMLERDDFEKRFKNNVPITILEFIYPLLQGYDSVAIKSDIELGGNDQKFNLIVGRELQKDAGQKPQVIMTMPLLEGTDGVRKMSKSYNNYISITEFPKDMFGKIMSIQDSLMLRYYELLTDEDMTKIKPFCESDPRNAKANLAYLIVKQYYGEEVAKRQKEEFDSVFKEKKVPKDIKELKLKSQKYELLDLVSRTGIVKSKTEIKRLLAQGGIKVNQEKVFQNIEIDLEVNKSIILQIGKINFIKIISE
ncbi:MAG: tyrosine--tRNA ligase, partial [Endomicrobiia bacterium]